MVEVCAVEENCFSASVQPSLRQRGRCATPGVTVSVAAREPAQAVQMTSLRVMTGKGYYRASKSQEDRGGACALAAHVVT